MYGPNPAIPEPRYGDNMMFGGIQPHLHFSGLQDAQMHDIHNYSYPGILYGGLPPQSNIHVGPPPPMCGNMYYEGYVLPQQSQNPHIQQFHVQHADHPNYPVHGLRAQVDHNTALMERFHNAHEARRQNCAVQGGYHQNQNDDHAQFDMQFNMHVHQNIMNLQHIDEQLHHDIQLAENMHTEQWQLYVALSHCTHPRNVKVLFPEHQNGANNENKIANVVFSEVLEGLV